MLNLLIADDEYFIRQRLKKIIPWDKLSLHFVGEAENGIQVLEMLQADNIDILILDIKMPQMTGIEAAGQIHKRYPHVHIIVLSGYNDFEYAQATLRLGVKDYLLKPVSAEDLECALRKCIESVWETKQKRHNDELYQHYKKCMVLQEVRSGSLAVDELYEVYPEYSHALQTLFAGIYIYDNTEFSINHLIHLLRDAGYSCEYTKENGNCSEPPWVRDKLCAKQRT